MLLKQLTSKLSEIWERIDKDGQQGDLKSGRIYQRLEIGNDKGFRVSCIFPERELELLIAMNSEKEGFQYRFPNWKGMEFAVVTLDVPDLGTSHVSLRLRNHEYKGIFISLCGNLAYCLRETTQVNREVILAAFLDRWTRFFANSSSRGMSSEKERGLFGELKWFQILLKNGIPFNLILDSWKGPEGHNHDFDSLGRSVEVKTTLTKEPRKVRISSERQLDTVGLYSLHLFVATLIQSEGGGETLPELISIVRDCAVKVPGAAARFENKLVVSGYHDLHQHHYTSSFTIRTGELFRVSDAFPRITDVPDGVGDLNYSLLVGSLSDHESEITDYVDEIREIVYGN